MGLVTSTGIFTFVPPNPSIGGSSSITGHVNDSIRVFGNDLDYIDTITLAGQICEFNLVDIGSIDVSIPSNPESGYLVASSNEFTVTGNPLVFYPIPKVTDFNPKKTASGELISVDGFCINSATGAYMYAQPLLDDINYTFSGEYNTFILTTESDAVNSNVVLIQGINLNNENAKYRIKNLQDFNLSSGRRTEVSYNTLAQKYYENHIFTYPSINGQNIQAFISGIDSGSSSYLITLPSGLPDTNYSVFYQPIMSGANYDCFVSGKNSNSFYINFNKPLEEFLNVHFLAIKRSGLTFDGGNYVSTGIVLQNNILSSGINFNNNKLYAPYLLTSCEYSGDGSGYIYNISNFTKNTFTVNTPYTGLNRNLILNYCTIINENANLDTFVFIGNSGGYKKTYLFSGNEESFKEKIYVNNFQASKNQVTFEVPYTNYYLNGKIGFIGPENINVETNDTFLETPLPTGVFPPFGVRGVNITISGKSFKKPILNDGTGDYNYINVRFRYADDTFKQNDNSFNANFLLIDMNTLSGFIPIENLPTGRYAIQMIAEDGELFE
jgi:hypothetical protein